MSCYLTKCLVDKVEFKEAVHNAGAVASIKAVAKAEDAVLPPPPPAVADMTDSWRAKVTVTMEQQADSSKLAAVYDGMREAFKRGGLNVAAIRATLCVSSRRHLCWLSQRNRLAKKHVVLELEGCKPLALPGTIFRALLQRNLHLVAQYCFDVSAL